MSHDRRPLRYGRASYSTSNSNYTYQENWFPEYDTARELLAPTGPYTVLPNGVYERPFANGIVVANPTGNSIPDSTSLKRPLTM